MSYELNPLSVEAFLDELHTALAAGDCAAALSLEERFRAAELAEAKREYDEHSEWAYCKDCREIADEFVKDCVEQFKKDNDGKAPTPDELRDLVREDDQPLHDAVDGNWWVIYTHANLKVLLYSSNDSAYVDEFGADGLVKDGNINYSAMAYMAMLADVHEDVESALDEYENNYEEPDPDDGEDNKETHEG